MADKGSGKRDSKSEIFKAAKALFAKKGYKATTVRDISSATGLNIGLVSYHFGSKENLYKAILTDLGEQHKDILRFLDPLPASQPEYRNRLKEFVSYLYDLYVGDMDGLVILSRETDNLSEIFDEVIPSTFLVVAETMTRFFEGGRQQGFLLVSYDPRLTAHMLIAQILYFCRMDKIRVRYKQASVTTADFREQLIDYHLRLYLGSAANS